MSNVQDFLDTEENTIENTSLIKPRWWWLSFCDNNKPTGEQFLGIAVVQGETLRQAANVAWIRGINPGGEVLGMVIPAHCSPPSELDHKFLSDKEAIARLEEQWAAQSRAAQALGPLLVEG